jgi:hypothetical protein
MNEYSRNGRARSIVLAAAAIVVLGAVVLTDPSHHHHANCCHGHDAVQHDAAAPPADAPDPVDHTPWPELSPHVTLPPFLDARVIYFNGFESPEGDPPIVRKQIAHPKSMQGELADGGFAGSALRLTGRDRLAIEGDALSPHRGRTLGFWWCLDEALPHNGGFGLFAWRGRGRRYLSHFARGGPWCGLRDSALVMQVYNFDGIRNVNGILDRHLRDHVALTAGAWHHTAVTVTGGSRMTVYLDGVRVGTAQMLGRTLRPADALQRLEIGGSGKGMRIDEVTVLDVSLKEEEVGYWVKTMTMLRDSGHLGAKSKAEFGGKTPERDTGDERGIVEQ